ncbi:hypothetical protein N5F23_24555 [Pseudomonas sichuanensis]|uniref:hypothetical protein n=1 Tax=Pseudomonas sichuanensis TaxID=2213015 RepID=UPI00244B5E4E|nr:hypothetical protein [Pseudomonas sichuanensis]MDH0733734.1 hypothetical protein [Pseudomonas sichuanensis]MDH1585771.1 hypothetical protein [Pseudomonas sichuanensis]MDH1595465.1 hypothetical protein [Pseudomonas sichuanensis]MDH1600792.1 hypothetical protein [Pseudomonas sichuanensis]
MTRAELDKFVQVKIDEKANIILDERVTHDDAAFGELRIYSCVRRILSGKASLEDIGMLHAVNDLIKAMGILSPNQSLGSKLKPQFPVPWLNKKV